MSIGGFAVLLVSDWSETQPINLSSLELKQKKKKNCNVSLFYSLQDYLEGWFSSSHLSDCGQLLFSAAITGGRTEITANTDQIEL